MSCTAHRLAAERVERLSALPEEPTVGLELKDALHVAVFTALGARRPRRGPGHGRATT